MFVSLAFVALLSVAAAQEAVKGKDESDGFNFDSIKDKVSAIVSGAAISCSNKYISGPYIESVLCDAVIPAEYTEKVGITFGASTPWCSALACVYRAMGCAAPTYRVEAKIIKATGNKEECAETVGLDIEHCNTLGKFIAKVPAGTAQKKREAIDNREAKLAAALALQAYAPHTDGLDELFDDVGYSANPDRKRGIVEELQVCSPLIAAGLKLIEGQVNLPINISDHLGPCGTVCNYAVCGFNILCGKTAQPMLQIVNRDRGYGGCEPLSCASFITAPESKCKDVTCPQAEGYWTAENCPPPKAIHNPTKTTKEDCCQRCDAPCEGVICRQTADTCGEPEFPLCAPYKFGKYDAFDCCDQCIDPCATAKEACPPPPTSCPAGQSLGPAHPGDCCLSCQAPCIGVSCSGGPLSAKDCPEGTIFEDIPATPTRCSECCPQCVVVNQQVEEGDAALLGVAAAASAVAAAASML